MAYLTKAELEKIPFKYLGKNVQISTKTSLYCPEKITIGNGSRIDDFCVIKGPLTLGIYVHISPFCLVSASEAEIILGDFVGLAYRVSVFSSTDDYSGATLTNPTVPNEFKNVKHGKVSIGRHVIVGTSSVIMPNITIGEGCSIGALTFVTKSTEPWGVYFGIPAKRLKERQKDLLKLEKRLLG
jgi:acetyltransferase-like isoleucine patch superfamily enzyme